MRNLMHLFILTLICSHAFGQSAEKPTIAEHYKTLKFDVAIFPQNSLDLIPGKRFTPTRNDVDLAESLLAANLKKLNKDGVNQYHSPVIHRNLNKYFRQYFGCVNENGHKILFVNSLWKDDFFKDWLDSRIMVNDGGSYYWQICVDLNSKTLFNLYVNGSG